MTNAMIAWGMIFLIGMLATHFMGIDPWIAWIAWLVIFFFGNVLIGKAMKKTPREIGHMWMVVNILGALLTIAFLTGTLQFDESKIMSIWLFIMGAAVFAGAHQMKNPEQIFVGLLWIATGIVLPIWFSGATFLVGGLIFGLPPVISGLLKK